MIVKKKLVRYLEISTFSRIEFWKIVELYRIIELIKANQVLIQDYQQYLGCFAKRMGGLMIVKKKLVRYLELSTFSFIEFWMNFEK